MNFLFFCGGSFIGGMEVVVQSLMAQLNQTGHRTLAIVSGWNNGDYPARLRASRIAFEEVKLGRYYRSRPLWTLDSLRNLPRAALTLRQLIGAFQPQVAIYPDCQLLLLGSLIMPKLRNVLYLHADAGGLRMFPSIQLVNPRLDRIVCVSEFVAATAHSVGAEPGKIAVVHNGVGLPAVEAFVPGHRPVTLGIVGRVSPQKQHMALIKAIDVLKRRQPSDRFRLRIIGTDDHPYAHEVKTLIGELHLQDIVEWSGFIPSQDDIYRDLDIVVAPAINEAFGMTIVEAASYGLPVVAARSGGFPEMVVDGETGFLFDVGDIEGFATALEKLITVGSLRQRLGQTGHAHAAKNFSIGGMAERFVKVLSA
jgi:glycosyltransferase involved in cell wall biosynthesis